MAQVKDFIGRGLNAARPNPSGTDRQYYDGYLYLQTDTAGAEVAGFYRYDGVGFVWELLASTGSPLSTEAVQDIVGALLIDSAEVDFTYNDGANTLSAALIAASIADSKLTTPYIKADGTGHSPAISQWARTSSRT
jgi:hypothetical protein